MQVSLTPTLTTSRKREAKRWLMAQLASSELADSTVSMSAISGNVAIYINGMPKMVYLGNWNAQEIARPNSGGYFTVSCGSFAPGAAPSKPERLTILGGIIYALDLWDELAEYYSQAMGRTILEAYQSCCLDMVQAPKAAVKLAFSADKQQSALQYADEPDVWYLNNGEPVKIDETWHQIAA